MKTTIINHLLTWLFLAVGHLFSRTLLCVSIVGSEHIPRTDEPLIITANHFSWFDAPLLTLHLPVRPAFLVATESQRFWFVRLFMRAFDGIPIWRGRVDRAAIRQAIKRLDHGKAIGIFPEGGIDPTRGEKRKRGEVLSDDGYKFISRHDAQLTHPQPGTAYLAVQSQARLLPVALLGTEKILPNILRLRRTDVTIHVGPVFGPLVLQPHLNHREQRLVLKELAEQIMFNIASLFPEENRGPYRGMRPEMI